MRLLGLVAFLVLPPALAWGQEASRSLRLSEIDARGRNRWIEVHNPSRASEPLAGYSLKVTFSDTARERIRVHLDELDEHLTMLPSGGFVVVCAGGVPAKGGQPDCSPSCSSPCMPLALDKDGGTVSLEWEPPCQRLLRTQVDAVAYPPLVGATFCRGASGEWCDCLESTPGGPNSSCAALAEPRVVINEASSAELRNCTFPGCPDWVELLWLGGAPVNLRGCVLASRGSEAMPFPPEGPDVWLDEQKPFALVVLGDVPPPFACASNGALVPFGLKAEGDSLVLRGPKGEDWDRVLVPRLQPGQFLARRPFGGDFGLTTQPSPCGANGPSAENLPPACKVIDRFPLRVHPGDAVKVYAEVLDPDGPADIEDEGVVLAWQTSQGEAKVAMVRDKEVTCEHLEEEGIYSGTIPGEAVVDDVTFEVEAADGGGNVCRTEPIETHVQPRGWKDPWGAHALLINEVAANEPNSPGDWIELYNPTEGVVLVPRLYVTDDIFRRDNRQLLDVEVPARGYLTVYLSDAPDAPEPRLPIRLDNCRDEVILLHADGETVIDAVMFHEEKREKSLSRIPDGGPDLSITDRSPGRPNESSSCFAFMASGGSGRPVINEVCADNWTVLGDRGQEFGDWIELYNPACEDVVLDCWSLSDNWSSLPDMPRNRWFFPAWTTIPPRGYLLVWCDNDDDCETARDPATPCRVEGSCELHTSFQLNRFEDFVQLLDPSGAVVDAVMIRYQPRDISVGRHPDGAGAARFLAPTPGAPNVPLPPAPGFLRGDANTDCGVDLADAVHTLNWLFLGGSEPRCPDAADADDDGRLTLSDAVATLGTLFLGQPPLPPPGPGGSGPDPTPDELGDCGLPGCQAPFLPRRCAELPEELTVGTDPCQP